VATCKEADLAEQEIPLARTLGLASTTALGLGAMIGAGIFVLTGMGAGEAGPALILAFALNGVIAVIVGVCYAELAAMLPRDGGAYVWAKPAFGPLLGFSAGWLSWFAQTIACALYATAFGSFAVELINTFAGYATATNMHWRVFISAGLLGALLWLNYSGAAGTGRLEILITALKVAILLVVIGAGFMAMSGNPDPISAYQPFMPAGWSGLIGAMGLTFVAFEGYEVIVQAAEETEEPSRTIPNAILLSIAVAVTIYLLVAVVLFGGIVVPDGTPVYQFLGQLGELGIMEAAGQFIPYGKEILLVAGLASTASALNATIYGSTRIAYAMGRDGDLPKVLAHVHPVHRTPYRAIQVTGIIMLITTLTMPIKDIAAAADITFLLVFVIVCACVIRLRNRWPEKHRPFRVAWVPVLPIIGILSGLVLSLGLLRLSLLAWLLTTAWLLTGLALHRWKQLAKDGSTQ
jgi:APA family basic amino acid/polyamine antiporter